MYTLFASFKYNNLLFRITDLSGVGFLIINKWKMYITVLLNKFQDTLVPTEILK